MNKEELITYLDAVCDAESAVDACNTSITNLDARLNSLSYPTQPQCPSSSYTYPEKKKIDRTKLGRIDSVVLLEDIFHCIVGAGAFGFFTLFVFAVIVGAVGEYILHIPADDNDAFFSAIPIMVVPFIISTILWFIKLMKSAKENAISEQKNADQRYADLVKAAEEEYLTSVRNIDNLIHRNEQEYNRKLQLYNDTCRIVDETRAALEEKKLAQCELLKHISLKLDTLYQRDIIYESCRNLVAVFTIREYLKMGICSELGGPNGAYAQYMQDVRFGRVCNSIDALSRAVVTSISHLQISLRHDLDKINRTLVRFDAGIKDNLNELQKAIHLSQEATIEQINFANAHLSSANETLSRIQSGTDVIAINQYIANRMAGVDAYLA